MDISDKVQDKLKKFSNQAKDVLDCAKLEIKIKMYGRECKKRYTKIGMLVYDSRKKKSSVNGEEIENLCCEIDKYKHSIKVIQRQIDDFKLKGNFDGGFEENDPIGCPAQKDECVKQYKFCPACSVGNEPDSDICVKCGYKFKK